MKKWTIKNHDGMIIAKNIENIDEWIKNNKNLLVVYRFNSIKELIVY